MHIEHPALFIIGCLLIIFAVYKLMFATAVNGHEDEDGFHRDSTLTIYAVMVQRQDARCITKTCPPGNEGPTPSDRSRPGDP